MLKRCDSNFNKKPWTWSESNLGNLRTWVIFSLQPRPNLLCGVSCLGIYQVWRSDLGPPNHLIPSSIYESAGNSPDFLAQKLRNVRCQVVVFSLALFSVIRPILQTMRSFVLLERWDPVFPTFWGPGSETSLEQALVFDAGSSGTRPEPRGFFLEGKSRSQSRDSTRKTSGPR